MDQAYSAADAMLARLEGEVEKGLPCEQDRLAEAIRNEAFWNLAGEHYIQSREGESPFDYQGREKRQSGFLRECVEVLTDDLYCPGPTRTFSVPAAHEVMEKVWTDNLIDALMLHADQLSHVNHIAAIQVDAGEGVFAERPCTLRLWGREEFVAWTDPDDPCKVLAVCTIDRCDQTTRYRLWTDESVRTYLTHKAGGTSGGRVAYLVSDEPNTYGVVPFGFFWYDLPLKCFEPTSPGSFLTAAELRIDDRLSRLDESVNKHLNPLPVAEGVPDGWSPVIEPQRFVILRNQGPVYGANGYAPGPPARLYYLQATPGIEAAWTDLMNVINLWLEAARVPLSSVRMETSGVTSGIALLAESAPLLKRARRRRAVASYVEAYLVKIVLTCLGNHYGKPELTAAAKSGTVALAWPEPRIPIPGPDRDDEDERGIKLGVKSRLQVIQERYSLTREQSIAFLRQLAEDRRIEEEIDPDLPAAVPPALTAAADAAAVPTDQAPGAGAEGETEPGLQVD
jgi:hypothetical protein